MLTGLPTLELGALAVDAWAGAAVHLVAAREGDACSLAWCALGWLRLVHVAAIHLCMAVFIRHFIIGFFSPSRT